MQTHGTLNATTQLSFEIPRRGSRQTASYCKGCGLIVVVGEGMLTWAEDSGAGVEGRIDWIVESFCSMRCCTCLNCKAKEANTCSGSSVTAPWWEMKTLKATVADQIILSWESMSPVLKHWVVINIRKALYKCKYITIQHITLDLICQIFLFCFGFRLWSS